MSPRPYAPKSVAEGYADRSAGRGGTVLDVPVGGGPALYGAAGTPGTAARPYPGDRAAARSCAPITQLVRRRSRRRLHLLRRGLRRGLSRLPAGEG